MNQSLAFAYISNEILNEYIQTLLEQERCVQTAKKYRRDLIRLMAFSPDGVLTKSLLVQWKETLILRYAPATVNTILAAVNGFLKYLSTHTAANKQQPSLMADTLESKISRQ